MVKAPEEIQIDTAEWQQARQRVEKKRKLRGDFAAYLVINSILVVAWAAWGFGYFWPGWVLGCWGALLLLDAWHVFFRRPITEEEIRREMHRG